MCHNEDESQVIKLKLRVEKITKIKNINWSRFSKVGFINQFDTLIKLILVSTVCLTLEIQKKISLLFM